MSPLIKMGDYEQFIKYKNEKSPQNVSLFE